MLGIESELYIVDQREEGMDIDRPSPSRRMDIGASVGSRDLSLSLYGGSISIGRGSGETEESFELMDLTSLELSARGPRYR